MIYLVNKETHEIERKFDNVIAWGEDFIEYGGKIRGKMYCDETHYFTDNPNKEE